MRRARTPFVIALTLALLTTLQPRALDALDDLVEAERAFARTATERGIRDSFLEFFAEDAIALVPGGVSAVERLRARPSRPFSEAELTWEPRAGDIAASGEMGWLTGPSTFIDHKTNAPPQYGNYLSIWRRQNQGPWRVYIDFGTQTPALAQFPPGFVPVRLPDSFVRAASALPSPASLIVADQALNAAVAASGMAQAYGARLASAGSRLHRQGAMPLVGRQAIVSWLEQHAEKWTFKPGTNFGTAVSGELGYTYSTYSAGAAGGAYVRVWARDAAGRWWLMVDAAS